MTFAIVQLKWRAVSAGERDVRTVSEEKEKKIRMKLPFGAVSPPSTQSYLLHWI